MASSKIQVTNKGQYTVTIPKKLAEFLALERGQKVAFKPGGKNKLELELS